MKSEHDDGAPEVRVAASLADAQAGRLTRHASVQALMEHLDGEQEIVGWVPPDGDKRPETVTRQGDRVDYASLPPPTGLVPLGELTVPKIEQGGPASSGEFTYIDISSVDNKLKLIIDPKFLGSDATPSRAKQRLKAGDVLVSMTRPNLNAVAIVPAEFDGAVGSTGFHVLRAKEGTEPRWLYYAVQTHGFISAMSELVQGALYPAVRPKDIRAFEIPHPPLDQQKRIVAEIEKQFSRLDEAVANLKRVKANLKRYKAAVLKAAVEGRLVETEAERARRAAQGSANVAGGRMPGETEGRSFETGEQLLQRILETRRSQWQGKGKYKEPAAPDTTDLPELPEGWVWATVSQLLVEPIVNGLSIKESSSPTEVRALRLSAMSDDGFDYRDHRFLPTRLEDVADIVIREGDFFVSRGSGSLHLVVASRMIILILSATHFSLPER